MDATPGELDPDLRTRLLEATSRLDGDAMRSLVHAGLDGYGVDTMVADLLVPVLRDIGDLWERGELGVMHEHHASHVILSVLIELAGSAPLGERRVVLACPPRELHDLPAHLFAALLRARGWAPTVLGADTAWGATTTALRVLDADACVITAMRRSSLVSRRAGLARIAASTPLFLAGPAAHDTGVTGATELPHDWRAAAEVVDRVTRRSSRS